LQGLDFFFGLGFAAPTSLRHGWRFSVDDLLPLTGMEVARRFGGVKRHKRG
jgi:hypothetical protein